MGRVGGKTKERGKGRRKRVMRVKRRGGKAGVYPNQVHFDQQSSFNCRGRRGELKERKHW